MFFALTEATFSKFQKTVNTIRDHAACEVLIPAGVPAAAPFVPAHGTRKRCHWQNRVVLCYRITPRRSLECDTGFYA